MSFKYTIYGLDENMNRVTEVIELDHELSAETLNSFSLVGFPEAQQSEQRLKYRITLDNGDEIIYSDWNTAFKAWMDNGGALEFVR